MPPALLDIVIVNWNAGRQLACVLESLHALGDDEHVWDRVIVVDNGSTDDSLDLGALPLPLHLIRNEANRGFAAACNQGADAGRAPFVLLLNPDARLERGSLRAPLEAMSRPENARLGVVGIQLVDESGQVARSCARLPTPRSFAYKMLGLDRMAPGRFATHMMTEWDHATTRDVDHVIGAFYLVRRELWTALGGLDERFFVYLEDLDFSWRARAAGWRVRYLADARAVHRGGGTSAQVKAARLTYSLHSRILFGFKHFSRKSAVLLTAGTLTAEPILRLTDAARRGSLVEMRDILAAFLQLWRRIAAPRPDHDPKAS